MSRIVGDVTQNGVELLRRPNQMVETLFLPETAPRSEAPIDLTGREPFPRSTLRLDFRVAQQTHNQMYMIGHHDEISQAVTIAVEVAQTVAHNLPQIAATKHASPKPFVERLQIRPGKCVVILAP